MNYRKNCFTYWFPKLSRQEVNLPGTLVFNTDKLDKNITVALRKAFWMKPLTKEDKVSLGRFASILKHMAKTIGGYPFFLRTGQTSHKHDWMQTCYIANEEALLKNAQNLAEKNIMVDFKDGLPINIWVARKLIKTKVAFKAFYGFPITLEARFFFKDKKYQCHHPYWPKSAISGCDDKDWEKKLKRLNNIRATEIERLKALTEKVAKNFNGYWSIDWLKGEDKKWYAIDMATGKDSYHFPGCRFADKSKS